MDLGSVIELKFVRDRTHAKRIGDELIIDIEHYRVHPQCKTLGCVVYDPDNLLIECGGSCERTWKGREQERMGELIVKALVV